MSCTMGQKQCQRGIYSGDDAPSNRGLPGAGLPNHCLISCRQILAFKPANMTLPISRHSGLTFLAAGDEAAGFVLARPIAVLTPQQHLGKIMGKAQQRNLK